MVEQIIELYSQNLLPMLCWVVSWFVLSVLLRRNDIVDIAWGLGFIYFAFWIGLNSGHGMVQYVIYSMVTLWGLRLSSYLLIRMKGKTEDFRYLQWRKDWGKYVYLRSFFQIYLLQTVLLMIIALPIVIASTNATMSLKWSFIPGALLWCYGFYWQSMGDWQKHQFKSKEANRGKLMQTGLWAKSRHPNYYGELCMWWGIWLCLCTYPMGWIGIISPILISWLIIKVSGVPMLEARKAQNQEFQAYKAKVPMLFPCRFKE